MKVLTYNVHGWRTAEGAPNVTQVAEVIAASGADLVGLNEVFHPQPVGTPALLDLAARLGMHWAFGPTQPAQGRPDSPHDHPPYGNALLSRWPVLAYAAHHLAPMTTYGKRGLLEVRVLPPSDRPLTVYVIHLDHRVEALRLEQWAAALTCCSATGRSRTCCWAISMRWPRQTIRLPRRGTAGGLPAGAELASSRPLT